LLVAESLKYDRICAIKTYIIRDDNMPFGIVTAANTLLNNTTRTHTETRAGAFFLMLHFEVVGNQPLADGEELVIPLNMTPGDTQTDIITKADGKAFWTRPIKGNTAKITLQKTGGAGGALSSSVRLIEVAVGQVNIFAHALGNYNQPQPGDPDAEDLLGFTQSAGVKWEEINATTAPSNSGIRRAADSSGLYIYVRPPDPVKEAGITTWLIGNASAVLMDGLLVLTAGHTVFDETTGVAFDYGLSGSFSPNYERTVIGEVKFYKVHQVHKHGYTYVANNPNSFVDYVALSLKPIKPEDLPSGFNAPQSLGLLPAGAVFALGQKIFLIHHPDGLTKRISRPNGTTHPSTIYFPSGATPTGLQDYNKFWFYNSDAVGGSSGAPIFAYDGNNANLIAGLQINIETPWNELAPVIDSYNWGPRSSNIFKHIHDFADVQNIKIAVVIDTSGSMFSLSGNPNVNTSKLYEAKEAAKLFFSLLSDDRRHEVALIEFNTNAGTIQQLALYDSTPGAAGNVVSRSTLDMKVNGLNPTGVTSIGDGLQAAINQLNAGGQLVKHILLMTDGMENESLWITDVVASLQTSGAILNIIGFGQPWNIRHQQMSQLAFANKGVYTHALDGLELKKHYAVIYGRVFESNSPIDPILVFPAGVNTAAPVEFTIWNDSSMTVIVGWDRIEAEMQLKLISPSGQEIIGGMPDVDFSEGATWMHLRLELPYNGEQNGSWQVVVERIGGDILRLRAHNAPVTCVAYRPQAGENFQAASGAADGTVFLWDVSNATAIRSFFLDKPNPELPGVAGLVFSPNGERLYTAYSGQPLVMWDSNTGRRLAEYSNDRLGMVTCIAINAEGNLLALGSTAGVDILRLADDNFAQMFMLNASDVWAVAFSPTNNLLAVGTNADGGSLSAYDLGNLESEVIQIEAEGGVTSLDFSPDGRNLLVGRANGSMSVYIVQTIEGLSFDLDRNFDAHPRRVTSVAYAPSGQYALSASAVPTLDGPTDENLSNLFLWDTSDWEILTAMGGHRETVLMVAFGPDGNQALSASADTTLIPWKIDNGAVPLLGALDFAERYFVNTTAVSDIHMAAYFEGTSWYYYTGDTYFPQVMLRFRSGARVLPAKIELEVTAPQQSPGNLLHDVSIDSGTQQAVLGDILPPRIAALNQLQQISNEPLVSRETTAYPLFDDGRHYDGAMGPDGLYGNALREMLKHEGHYTFRAIARYGDNLGGMREVTWSIYVQIGIDPEKSDISVTNPDGQRELTVEITPRDRYGNDMGLGNGDQIIIQPPPGTKLNGELIDLGNGRYQQKLVWDGRTPLSKGVFVGQPARQPVWVGADPQPGTGTNQPTLLDNPPGEPPCGCLLVLVAEILKWLRNVLRF
jgi:WD40 repeat protein